MAINKSGGVTLGGHATVNGTLSLTNGVFSVGGSTLTINNGITVGSGGLASGPTGTIVYGQSSPGQTVLAINYGNLGLSNFSKALASAGVISISGTFSPGSATGHTVTGSTIDFNGSGTQTIPSFNYNNLTSSGGPRTLASSGTIGIAGIFTPGSNTYTNTGSTIDFNGGGSQTIPSFNYNNLMSSGGGARTLTSGGTIGVTGTFTPGTNSYSEGDETLTISLSGPSGTTLGPPSTATIRIIDNEAADGPNPIDTAQFFANQHYFDFLNRIPDPSGLAFWTNEITVCGSDVGCIEVKRINISAAFYLSIEFQQTGYLVERIYKVAFGDAIGDSVIGAPHQLAVPIVRFNEFLGDTQQVRKGVVVLQPGWEQVLENNKQAFTADFVQRTRFTDALPTTWTPAQFVTKLNENAGNVLSVDEYEAAVNLFGEAANTANMSARALALRQVAEDQDLQSAEFNRAFVLMQYFGYLRRNPNDPQDTDYSGFDFWLTKLNQFNGNFINAEMVKAFITSIEYRKRFGP